MLVFAGKPDSRHGAHWRRRARAARPPATITEHDQDWRDIKGVQLWGTARVLQGAERARAFAVYLAQFPFVSRLLADVAVGGLPRDIALFGFEAHRAALTDNSTGFFGRVELTLGSAWR